MLVFLLSIIMRIKGGLKIAGKELPEGRAISSIAFGLVMYFFCDRGWFALGDACAWWLANWLPLGEFLGNLNEDPDEKSHGDIKIIVKLLDYLGPIIFHALDIHATDNNIKLFYGWCGTFCRGVIFGIPLCVTFFSFFPMISAMCMPWCYFFGFQFEKQWPTIFKKQTNFSGWGVGEMLYGACIGLGILQIFN